VNRGMECMTTFPVSVKSPLLPAVWPTRLSDAASRYMERLLLVPGVGYGFTNAIERVSASVRGGMASGSHFDNVTVPGAGTCNICLKPHPVIFYLISHFLLFFCRFEGYLGSVTGSILQSFAPFLARTQTNSFFVDGVSSWLSQP